MLAQLLDSLGHSHLFSSGRLPLSVHNHLPKNKAIQYTLLETSNSLVTSDVQQIAANWSLEGKLQLEARMLIATAEPICLEPDVTVALVDNCFHYKQKLMSGLTQSTRKGLPTRHPPLFGFVARLRERRKNKATRSSERTMVCEEPATTMEPSLIDVPIYAKVIPWCEVTANNSTRLVQQYIMETIHTGSVKHTAKVFILQTPTDEQYYGILVTYFGESQSQCMFRLGSLFNVRLYINQFRVLFTEEGQKPVKITRLTPGKDPLTWYTRGFILARQTQTGALVLAIAEQKRRATESPVAPSSTVPRTSLAYPTIESGNTHRIEIADPRTRSNINVWHSVPRSSWTPCVPPIPSPLPLFQTWSAQFTDDLP